MQAFSMVEHGQVYRTVIKLAGRGGGQSVGQSRGLGSFRLNIDLKIFLRKLENLSQSKPESLKQIPAFSR